MHIGRCRFFALLVLFPMAGHSHPQACPVSDLVCLDNSHVQACNVSENTIESCLSWLNALQDLFVDNPSVAELSIVKGYANYSLYEMLRNSDSELSQIHRNIAKTSYQAAYKIDESNIQAMRGLSTTSDTTDEVKYWNIRILEVDPSDNIASRRITSLLILENGEQGYLDAARLLTENYLLIEAGSGKWSIAEKVVQYLEYPGHEGELESFRRQVAQDAALNGINNISNEDVIEKIDMVLTMISTSCNYSIMTIFNGSYCETGIQSVISTPVPDEMLWEVDHLDRFLGFANSLFLYNGSINPDTLVIESELEEWIDNLINQGTETGSLYQMYQYLVRDDPSRALAASVKAAELDPDNGDYQLLAGRWLLQNNHLEMGIDYLEMAKQHLPLSRHQSVDMLIQSAQTQLQ